MASHTLLPALIQQMMQPEFYPHPVKEPIELIQTHVSYVLLTGDYAYKLKKPVNFGFLNYSTLELRQHFCQEELRLNQRGAGEIYLEVLPITQEEQYHLGGVGKPVEYVLKMRQFPQEALFLSMFERGELDEARMEELGRVVAQYHAQTATNDYIRKFGEVEQVRQSIDENYDQTVKYIGGPQTRSQFEETKKYTDNFFAQRQQLFSDRIANDWIRECHGDLHLRNICLWHDKILLFDCIEFNEPFRFVDVMFDIAYAVMELEMLQRPNLGNAYLNTYIEQTGDWEGLQVLPLYLSRQSYVRAKVNSFLLDDPGVPETVKQEAAKTAAAYYKLAWEYTKPRQGKLILMSGLSGSGKSTVARQLARNTKAVHIRSDAVRKHLAGIPLLERGGDEVYTTEMTQKTYARLLDLGLMLATQGYTVILDAKYDRISLRHEAIASAQAQQLPLQIIHCTAPIEVLRDRLSSRTGDIADATIDLLETQQAAFEPFTTEEHLVKEVNTTQEIESQLMLE
ncbi:AAA family ATPase [Chroogloeocystis siderophila]|jgi:aminoglycoside phosphotransferase family enzyme/predicted kinase|uniref:gluconokinase n=1 Tax=Chroogloeocystis siderophila 5.2 s.c.1 TaxID=247279 RepID=A0A1U7HME6_9CHRO|nr:AAA family ATPase [Chroogloeocystis siderophila]OKH24731.1 adenylyl-sulfate kinase [Chroogloeocystis siderophila 5.2 s.c.1]